MELAPHLKVCAPEKHLCVSFLCHSFGRYVSTCSLQTRARPGSVQGPSSLPFRGQNKKALLHGLHMPVSHTVPSTPTILTLWAAGSEAGVGEMGQDP